MGGEVKGGREEGTGRRPQFDKNHPRHQIAGYGPVCAPILGGWGGARATSAGIIVRKARCGAATG